MDTLNQSCIFMATVYGGLITGVLYDLYRLLRRVLKAGRAVTAIFDVLFCISTLAVAAAVLYAVNRGELRAYTFVGFALGFSIYFAGVSLFLRYLFAKLAERIGKKRDRKKASDQK